MTRPTPTPQQQEAISARGNVLVVAGAGAGKTQTVVDRCLAWLLDEKNDASIDQVLMVTFTNAAAAEMRRRLRLNLDAAANLPEARRAEQLALLDTAHICTLHSFCLHLVGRHFYELGLDGGARILPEERAALLARESMDRVLERAYAGDTAEALAIQQFIQSQGGDWDAPARELILQLHHYTQTLRDPAGWRAAQRAAFETDEPGQWRKWLMEELPQWRKGWMAVLQAQAPVNSKAAECARILSNLSEKSGRSDYAVALGALLQADGGPWPKPKTPAREPIKKMFEEAAFLRSVCAVEKTDPLAEDWQWARRPMLALLDLARQFDAEFLEAKRREGALDYHDLEQFTLRLLWKDGCPSEIARQWRKKFRLIFVDEYQDINQAQEAIIQALGREGPDSNRFLVGDVKQSIYGFRLADPGIFLRYHEEWESGRHSKVIPLTDNFRSHEGILNFVNGLFAGFMQKETGGVNYNEAAYLRFGNPEGRAHLASNEGSPPVELLLRCPDLEDDDDETESLSDMEKEARMVCRRLINLKRESQEYRWSDMVILLRSPKNKVEAYAKEFGKAAIPLLAARGGFYESLEVRDLLNLLHVLDNPLQDLPLLGVLRSPLVGLTAEELAKIRLVSGGRERFWLALEQWHRSAKGRDVQYQKVDRFRGCYEKWRGMARHSSVSLCLEQIIDETHYDEWLGAQERGAQRRANVERLLNMAREFDVYDGESLYRFLRFVEAQQENEAAIEPAAAPVSDAVRLMSIHQSKGLEFPVVVVADLGKRFNFTDSGGRIILDEEFGLCPHIHPPEKPQFYPSLPHWLAQRRQRKKTLGEEMRLLYVAMTRAERRLILAGTARKSSLEKKWPERALQPPVARDILAAQSYLDWIGPWLARLAGPEALRASGQHSWLTWTVECGGGAAAVSSERSDKPDSADVSDQQLQRLQWNYRFENETAQPAKTSVTNIRRQIADESDGEAVPLFPTARREGSLSAAEIGRAHHTFLQWFSLGAPPTLLGFKAEAARLAREKLLSPREVDCLDLDALVSFWDSKIGWELSRQANCLQRELEFTARFGAVELRDLGCARFVDIGEEEFVVVQGVVDLAVVLPGQIWLLDFKTDQFAAADLDAKIADYRPQILLYAKALERIYNRPVKKSWLHFLGTRRTIAA